MSGIYNAALDDVTLENEDQFYRVNPRILALTDDVRLGLKTYLSTQNWYNHLCEPIYPTTKRSTLLKTLLSTYLLEMPELFYDCWQRLSLTRLYRDMIRYPVTLVPVISTYCHRKLVAMECEVNLEVILPFFMVEWVKHLKVTGPQSPSNDAVENFIWTFRGSAETVSFKDMDINVTYTRYLCEIRAEILILLNCNFVGLSDGHHIRGRYKHLLLYNCYITDSNGKHNINSFNEFKIKFRNRTVVYIVSNGYMHITSVGEISKDWGRVFDDMNRRVYQKIVLCNRIRDRKAINEIMAHEPFQALLANALLPGHQPIPFPIPPPLPLPLPSDDI